jgi:hypothetical protein
LAKLTPLRFRWDFDNYTTRFVASDICKSNVKVTILFRPKVNYAARESVPFLFTSDSL